MKNLPLAFFTIILLLQHQATFSQNYFNARNLKFATSTDYNGDGKTDIAFHQPIGIWNTVPTLFSKGDGTWESHNAEAPSWANQPGVISISGDYNGDGKTDIAFHRPGSTWNTVPVLLSNGNGTWKAINSAAPSWANQPNVISISGDFNGDGRTDIAFHRPGSTWNTLPILFSKGNGTWNALNKPVPAWANQPDVISIIGDYNGDGKTDIAFHRPGSTWNTLPILFSNGNGTWNTLNNPAPDWVNQPNVIATPGDFDGDGKTDIAFHRPGSSWRKVPVLFSNSDGSWRNGGGLGGVSEFLVWANREGTIFISGDFNGDGKTDIAFHHPDYKFNYLPVLFSSFQSIGHVTFHTWGIIENPVYPNSPNQLDAVALPGDYNGDNITDIAFYAPGRAADIALFLGKGDGTWIDKSNILVSEPDWTGQFVVIAVRNATNRLGQREPWNTFIDIQNAYLKAGGKAGISGKEYREMIFRELRGLRTSDINTILRRMVQIVDFTKSNNADGLEPLLFAYLDAIAVYNSFVTTQFTKQIFNKYNIKNNASWPTYKKPPLMNVLMPMGRISTPVVIDMRADAARELISGFKRTAPNFQNGIPTLEDLLGDNNVLNDFCSLPTISDAGGSVLPSEKQRQEICQSGDPSSGGLNGSLGQVSFGACLNLTPNEAEQAGSMANCMLNYLLPTIGDQTPGPDLDNAILGGLGLLAGLTYWIYEKNQEFIDKYNAYQFDIIDKTRELEDATTQFDRATEDLDDAKKEGASEEVIKEKERAAQDAETKKVRAEEDLEVAKSKLKNLLKEKSPDPVDKINNAQELKDCMCQNMSPEVCNGLFPGSYFQEIVEGKRSPLDPFINPNPEASPTEEEVFRTLLQLGICGIDYNSNRGGSQCGNLVICENASDIPDFGCVCKKLPGEQERAQAQEMSDKMCSTIIRCPEGQTVQSGSYGCHCAETGDGSDPAPAPGSPLPRPPVDLMRIFYFNNGLPIDHTLPTNEKVMKQIFSSANRY